uniref:Uncharacterized protein n=1 Tax=Knipowitschia caucasica TaxID=637954 RepID=A0AAV2M111_KNICA
MGAATCEGSDTKVGLRGQTQRSDSEVGLRGQTQRSDSEVGLRGQTQRSDSENDIFVVNVASAALEGEDNTPSSFRETIPRLQS